MVRSGYRTKLNQSIIKVFATDIGECMKVKELIELLEAFDGDLEVLVDCRSLDNAVVYESNDYYQDETVVMLDT